ncbi:hypothetical protein SJI19_23600 [Acerihabitans sp. TG2]|uniref:hypothetical protein n=1 Tax=Acerihabitans sp. TG2 TaxID=3096008 RepID=UPI002B22562A|nr:hypothetical protein [Acerihabitans sp. TG2]MEA9393477.1 hypothetical protein [Acerihabitans sp. TG2]
MQSNNFEEGLIDDISKIESYPGWDKNSKIVKLLKIFLSILLITLGILSLGVFFLCVLDYFSLTGHNFKALMKYPLIFIIFTLFFILLICVFLFSYLVISYLKKINNIEIVHNYNSIVIISHKTERQIDIMKLIVKVNLNKANNEVTYFTQFGTVFAFIMTFTGAFVKAFDKAFEILFESSFNLIVIAFIIMFMSISLLNLYLFNFYKKQQRNSSYALSILDAAISYANIKQKGTFKIKTIKG